MYQRGDIVLVPFPFTDLTSTKRRPALVISNDLVNNTGDLIIVMITSQDKKDFLQIEIDSANITPNLPKKSYVRYHKITIVDSSLVVALISKADETLLEQVKQKIHLLLEAEVNPAFAVTIAD
ncbi:MAG: type toxin-antitoxin system PemK/MazF family toxin [Bacteroidetes bacterium]|nr:type toxin-antitoxin system PemK/MazF family toxin [Bacteroidota bacterium]